MSENKIDKRAEREAKKVQKQLRNAARNLQRTMLRFAQDERFAVAMATAVPIYWDTYYTIETADEMDLNESLRFFDWFVFDFVLDEETPRLFDTFAEERFEELTEREQELVDSWRDTPPASAFEYVDYDAFSQLFKLREHFSGEETEAYSTAGSGYAKKGDLILTRLLPVGDELIFGTVGAYIPQDEIGDLTEKIEAAKKEDADAHPDATHNAFLRRHGHLIIHHGLNQSVAHDRFAVSRLDPSRMDKTVKRTAKKMAQKFKKKRKK